MRNMILIQNRFMKIKSHISIHIQDTLHKQKKLKLRDCYNWLGSVSNKKAEITVRIVTEKESRTLNKQYRKKDKATNILSFLISDSPIIGDLILCHPIIKKEAKIQNKKIKDHYAHLLIHGYLHLLGYDHEKEEDAIRMEGKEKEILKTLGLKDPYLNNIL